MPADFLSKIFTATLIAGRMLAALWIYPVVGALVAAVVDVRFREHLLRLLPKNANAQDVAAWSLVGMISPVCTIGTVPILIEFEDRGAKKAPLIAFLAASSSFNPQMGFIFFGVLGWKMTLYYIVAVFLMACFVGALVGKLCKGVSEAKRAERLMCWGVQRSFLRHFVGLLGYVGVYFVVGVFVAAMIRVFIPPAKMMALFGEGHWYAVPLAGIGAAPTYMCAGASAPVVRISAELGMSKGAAMAYLIAGPSTRISALAAASTLLAKREMLIYVGAILGASFVLGGLYGLVP